MGKRNSSHRFSDDMHSMISIIKSGTLESKDTIIETMFWLGLADSKAKYVTEHMRRIANVKAKRLKKQLLMTIPRDRMSDLLTPLNFKRHLSMLVIANVEYPEIKTWIIESFDVIAACSDNSEKIIKLCIKQARTVLAGNSKFYKEIKALEVIKNE